jgi:hypothetical protein
MYCEADMDEFVAVNAKKRKLLGEDEIADAIANDPAALMLFPDAAAAREHGYVDKAARKRSA